MAFCCVVLGQVSKRMLSDTVTDENIAEVVSRATGIPIGTLLQGEVRMNHKCSTSWIHGERV